MKVWQRPGPAKALYDHFLQSPSIVESWVDSIRRSWGDPYHPDLLLFPQVERQDLEIANDTGDAVAVTRFVPPEPGGDVMVYIHGGGWIAPVSGKHLAWARKLAAQTAIEVISVNYRLAPEHPFPAALLDCVTVYQAVRESTDGRVYVGGDSAGGNLSAALVQYCRAQRLTIPDKLLCLCPLTDFYLEKYPSVVKKGIGNPQADVLLLPFQRICYVPDQAEWTNPLASPIYGDWSKTCRTLVLVAGDDPLSDDNLAFAAKLQTDGADVELAVYEDMPHTFYTYPQFLPREAEQVDRHLATFLCG